MNKAHLFLKVTKTQREQVIFATPAAVRLKVTFASKLRVDGAAALEGCPHTRIKRDNLGVFVRKISLKVDVARTP